MKVDNNVAFENNAPRVDAHEKITGSARYSTDIYPKNMVYAHFIRFPFGSGKVKSSQVEKARKMPGIVEIELEERPAPYAGSRIGHILGESRDAIEDALEAMELEFERGDVRSDWKQYYEGVPAVSADRQKQLDGLYGKAVVTVEATYTTQVQNHSCFETHGALVDHRGMSAEVWATTQGTYGVLEGLPGATGLSQSNIQVHCEYIGGGFGSKLNGPGPEGNLAARLSRKHKRPVRLFLDREGDQVDTGNRPGSVQYMKIAADKDGKLLGGRVHCVGIVGHQPGGGGVSNPDNYNFGNVERTEAEITLTACRPRPFRAPGCPQGVFALESMMDELAAKLGLDPIEFRKKNEQSARRRKQLDMGAQIIGWDRRQPDGSGKGRIKRGIGVAGGHWNIWPGNCLADVDVFRSGAVEIRSGVQDIGTGTRTVVVDVAAEILQVHRNQITGKVGNSDYPEGPMSGGSMTARLVSPAVMDGCHQVLDKLKALVAAEWTVEPSKVDYKNGVFGEIDGSRAVTWSKACSLMSSEKLSTRGEAKREYWGEGDTDAVQFAEVEVDTETGIVRVKKIVAVQTCGQVVNRMTAENQVCGGVIQGVSYALFEDRIIDKPTGGIVNADFHTYKIAGSVDIPEIIPVLDWTEEDTGVRSLGEPVTIPTSGAIANAVANALGVRVRDLPITPERVLAALEAKGGST